MSLHDELKAVLELEAELREPPRPDLAGIVRGGQARRRRRTALRVGAGIVAVALIGGGAYGVRQLDPKPTHVAGQPSPSLGSGEPTPYVDLDQAVLSPGTYRMPLGTDDGVTRGADLVLSGSGWRGSDHPIVTNGVFVAGASAYRPRSLAAGTGCLSDRRNFDVSSTMAGLARQLSRLPRSSVLKPPTPTMVAGEDALHLRLRIDTACVSNPTAKVDGYCIAESETGLRGLAWRDRLFIVDFWVVDLPGDPVVVDMFRPVQAPPALVEQARTAAESVRFVTTD